MVKSFRDLLVWQKALDVTDAIYAATADFPRTEMYGLAAQVRKAAVSIPSNIAEGWASGGGRYLYHLRIAIGSEAEVQTQVEIALRRTYISQAQARALLEETAEVGRMLRGLLAALERRQALRRIAGTTTLLLCAYAATLMS